MAFISFRSSGICPVPQKIDGMPLPEAARSTIPPTRVPHPIPVKRSREGSRARKTRHHVEGIGRMASALRTRCFSISERRAKNRSKSAISLRSAGERPGVSIRVRPCQPSRSARGQGHERFAGLERTYRESSQTEPLLLRIRRRGARAVDPDRNALASPNGRRSSPAKSIYRAQPAR